jgi:hypothetical protein
MKGSPIYNILLFIYCYISICIDQTLDYILNFRANVRWIRENGVYKGKDSVETSDR